MSELLYSNTRNRTLFYLSPSHLSLSLTYLGGTILSVRVCRLLLYPVQGDGMVPDMFSSDKLLGLVTVLSVTNKCKMLDKVLTHGSHSQLTFGCSKSPACVKVQHHVVIESCHHCRGSVSASCYISFFLHQMQPGILRDSLKIPGCIWCKKKEI